jgi:hypothetical protein
MGVTPAMTVENGMATLEFTAYDVTDMNDYSWITSQGKPGVMAVKVVFGCELGILTWFSDDANGGDNWYLELGTYTITLDIANKAVTVTKA